MHCLPGVHWVPSASVAFFAAISMSSCARSIRVVSSSVAKTDGRVLLSLLLTTEEATPSLAATVVVSPSAWFRVSSGMGGGVPKSSRRRGRGGDPVCVRWRRRRSGAPGASGVSS
jgi:hypothetical protein